ncbi:MAG: hypothetical protein ACP5QP_07670, partial [Brevinematia bacterium]
MKVVKLIFPIVFIFVFLSCVFDKPIYKDSESPIIIVYSPENYGIYSTNLNISLFVSDTDQKGNSSGLKLLNVKAFDASTYPSILKFETNIPLSSFGTNISFDINLLSYYLSTPYNIVFSAYDNANNYSSLNIPIRVQSSPIFAIYFNTYYYLTNTNYLELSGSINVDSSYFGDVTNVRLVVSNGFGVFSTDVSSFDNSLWYFVGTLNLEEVGFTSQNNLISVVAFSSNGSSASNYFYLYYDTNKPFTKIVDPTNNQNIPLRYLVIVSNYDNYSLFSNVLLVISSNNQTNYVYGSYSGGYYSYDVIFSESGTNKLVSYAKDDAGNESFGIPVSVLADNSIPYIAIYSPCSNGQWIYTNAYNVNFQGLASVGDGSNITNVTLLIYTNSVLIRSNSLSFSSSNVNWSITTNIPNGTNLVYYYAFSDNGKVSYTNYIVAIVDSIRPIAQILSPANGIEVTNSNINLIAAFIDTNFSLGISGYVYTNDGYFYSFYSSSITNTNNILLKPGINRIKVFA